MGRRQALRMPQSALAERPLRLGVGATSGHRSTRDGVGHRGLVQWAHCNAGPRPRGGVVDSAANQPPGEPSFRWLLPPGEGGGGGAAAEQR